VELKRLFALVHEFLGDPMRGPLLVRVNRHRFFFFFVVVVVVFFE
jgi:hypothetical protein